MNDDGGQDARTLALALKCRFEALRRAARSVVADALRKAEGNLVAAGELIGVGRKALGKMLSDDEQLERIRLDLASKRVGVGRPPVGLETRKPRRKRK